MLQLADEPGMTLPPACRSNLEPNIYAYTALLALPRNMSEVAAPELLRQVGKVARIARYVIFAPGNAPPADLCSVDRGLGAIVCALL